MTERGRNPVGHRSGAQASCPTESRVELRSRVVRASGITESSGSSELSYRVPYKLHVCFYTGEFSRDARSVIPRVSRVERQRSVELRRLCTSFYVRCFRFCRLASSFPSSPWRFRRLVHAHFSFKHESFGEKEMRLPCIERFTLCRLIKAYSRRQKPPMTCS